MIALTLTSAVHSLLPLDSLSEQVHGVCIAQSFAVAVLALLEIGLFGTLAHPSTPL
jgi:hypothetical protein